MKLSSRILLGFSTIIVLSVADSYTNYLLSQKVRRNTAYLSRSEAIIRNSNKAHKAVIEMQSAFRGFLLTDDTTFLNTYYNGINAVPALFVQERKLTKGNTVQAELLDSISALHAKWVDYSGQLISSRIKMGESEAAKAHYAGLFNGKFKNRVGKTINDKISEMFNRFDRVEYRTRNSRSAMLAESINNTHTISFVFLALTLIVGVISTYYIVTLISKRIQSMVRLAENISKGEFSVMHDQKNDELTGLSRSLNIMSDKLRRNIGELEHRNAELNKFAYVVSHDLKAPVRGIHNVVKWIEEDHSHELSPQVKKYLQVIPERTLRMEALINGLLDYATINKVTPRESVDTRQLVADIASAIVPRNFTVDIIDMPVINAERIKLEQVFGNLMSNAVKYTPREDGHISVKCQEHAMYYEFSIADNGIGIAKEYHGKVFEMFQTLREKDEKESTGVGLAIVKKIMIESQGTIRVVSEPGHGAEFIFTWRKK